VSDANSRSEHRRSNVPSDRTVILFLPDGRTVLVTLHVLGIVDAGGVTEQLMCELMNGCAPDATSDGDDEAVTTRAWWRIRDGAMSVQLKVDEALAAKAGN
jgi:hypothetical protein